MEKAQEVLLVLGVMFGAVSLFFFTTGQFETMIPFGSSEFPALFVTGGLSVASFLLLLLFS